MGGGSAQGPKTASSAPDALGPIIERGLAAIEAEDLDAAEEALDEAGGVGGENHVQVLHLAGLLAWARDDVDRATGFLMQAVDLSPKDPKIYLDAAECLFSIGEDVGEAEAAVRSALALDACTGRVADEGRLLLSQIRLADNDPDEALEVLEQIDPGLREHPAFLSTRGAALMACQRFDDAIADLRRAAEVEPDDPDYHYQLGITYLAANRTDEGRASLLKVLELDVKPPHGEPREPPDFTEVQDMRSRLEDVLEDLPDPILQLVANAPITVQGRATADQVRQGLDPRSAIAFVGTPRGEAGEQDGDLQGIVVMRDLVLDEVDDDEEISEALFYALMEEIQFFFQRDDLVGA